MQFEIRTCHCCVCSAAKAYKSRYPRTTNIHSGTIVRICKEKIGRDVGEKRQMENFPRDNCKCLATRQCFGYEILLCGERDKVNWSAYERTENREMESP